MSRDSVSIVDDDPARLKPFDPKQPIAQVEHLARMTSMREATRDLHAASEHVDAPGDN